MAMRRIPGQSYTKCSHGQNHNVADRAVKNIWAAEPANWTSTKGSL
jgi:hypothetical protein